METTLNTALNTKKSGRTGNILSCERLKRSLYEVGRIRKARSSKWRLDYKPYASKTSTNSPTSVTTGGLSSPTSLVPTTNNNNSTSNNNNNNNVPVSPEHRPASTDPPSNDLFMKIKDIREDRKSKTFRADLDDAKDDLGDLTMQPMYGAKCSRMIRRPSPVVTIYVRKEEEKAYNSIMLKILTVSELVNALASKYAIPIEMIKNTMKKTKKGLLVNFDDQMVEQFVDEDDFIISMDFDNQMGTVDLVIKY